VSRDCNAQGYDRLLEDGDVILFGHEEILIIATPGHTPGSVSYLWRDRLFTGDTLLIGGCGRTDFQNGSAEALWDSITGKLFKLDEQILVYPGHDYKGRRVSSIGEEKRLNARLANKTREEFLSIMANLGLPMPARVHEAVPSNLGAGADQPGVAGASEQWAALENRVAMQNVSARQLAEVLRAPGVHLVDVRTPAEFETVRIAGAVNLPLDRLDAASLLARIGRTPRCTACARPGHAASSRRTRCAPPASPAWCTSTAAPTPGRWRACPCCAAARRESEGARTREIRRQTPPAGALSRRRRCRRGALSALAARLAQDLLEPQWCLAARLGIFRTRS